MPNLTELAARCEAADGPDRALDGEPVAWMYSNADDLTPSVSSEQWREPEAQGWTEVPLFTHPPRNDAVVEALREALETAERAIAEYYRYWTGGEMRGSYDGKPERQGLWEAQRKARAQLAALKQGEPR